MFHYLIGLMHQKIVIILPEIAFQAKLCNRFYARTSLFAHLTKVGNTIIKNSGDKDENYGRTGEIGSS